MAEAKRLLEIALAADAVERLSDEALTEVSWLWDDIRTSAERGEYKVAADFGRRRVIMSRIGNRFIIVMLAAVYELTIRWDQECLYSPVKRAAALARPEKIVLAARSRDGRTARAAPFAYFDTSAARLSFATRWRDCFAADHSMFGATTSR